MVLLASPTALEKIVGMMITVVSHVKKVFVHQDKHVLVENVIQILRLLVIKKTKILLVILQEHVVKIDYNVAMIHNSVLTRTLIVMSVEIRLRKLRLIFVKEIKVLNSLIVQKYQSVKEVVNFVLVIKKTKILLVILQEHVVKIDYNVAMIHNSVLTRTLIVMSVEIRLRKLRLIFVKEIKVLISLIVQKYQIVKEVINFVLVQFK